MKRVADDRSQERRSAGDDACQTQYPPARNDSARERRGNTEAFRRIMKAEADDETDGDCGCARCSGCADSQAFRKVMRADADGDYRCKHVRIVRLSRRAL